MFRARARSLSIDRTRHFDPSVSARSRPLAPPLRSPPVLPFWRHSCSAFTIRTDLVGVKEIEVRSSQEGPKPRRTDGPSASDPSAGLVRLAGRAEFTDIASWDARCRAERCRVVAKWIADRRA